MIQFQYSMLFTVFRCSEIIVAFVKPKLKRRNSHDNETNRIDLQFS